MMVNLHAKDMCQRHDCPPPDPLLVLDIDVVPELRAERCIPMPSSGPTQRLSTDREASGRSLKSRVTDAMLLRNHPMA